MSMDKLHVFNDMQRNASENLTDATTVGLVESSTDEKFVPFVKERTSLGKLITLSRGA